MKMKTTAMKFVSGMCAGLMAGVLAAPVATASDVPAEAARFHVLVGQWKGNATLRQGDAAQDLTLAYSCGKVAAGWGVACEMKAKGKDMEVVENDLMGVDPVSGTAHWFAVTSAGETHDHVGRWVDDQTFQARYAWKAEGKSMEENITMRFPDTKRLEFRSVVSVDGKEVGSFSGKLSR